ncbi:thiol-disulfide oxidoreductase DCC family protein [Natronomonas sp. EA1]|uniref:thiol-disulfide oxidoreductase DCC family protein n=1 Tax=Natronomonas sp. EA1 TaxID=3421655 RepID=UPI003EBF389E
MAEPTASEGAAGSERTSAADSDPVPSRDREHPVVLFDGVCSLCDWSVRFILDHERAGSELHFASLQSEVGTALLEEHGLGGDYFDSLVYLDGEAHTASDGALKIAEHLETPWRWLRHLHVVPRPLRDAGYRLLARVRYRLFGKKDSCRMPDHRLRERFR